MKSIRRRITVLLLAGLGLLGLAGGTAVYVASAKAMLARIDAENQQLCRQVRSLTGGRGGGGRWSRGDEAGELIAGDLYYQVSGSDGSILHRSESLAGIDLPLTEVPMTAKLAPDLELRLVTTSFGGGGGGPPWAGGGRDQTVVTVGRDITPYRQDLRRLLVAMIVIGAVAAAAAHGIILLALRSGLRPLRELDASLARVDANNLDARFHRESLPDELRPVARRLDDLMSRLGDSFQRERDFGSALAHEMRTPVAELRALAELAIEWPEERSETQMRSIHEVSRRLERMVDTLLELARVENDRLASSAAVDLRPIIEDLLGKHQALADQRRLTTRLEWPEGATLPGRPEWWRHLLGNLLSNAVEYAREGGFVDLAPIPGGLSLSNSIDDLADDDLPRMFERFWRADRARTGERHSGLGLALARACAMAMGYRIEAAIEDDGDRRLVMRITRSS